MSVNTGLQPVGNQVQTEAQTATQAAVRQAQQSVQITDYTYVYETNGVGVVEFKAMFDVAFTQEPVMHHGMSLPDLTAQVLATTAGSGSGSGGGTSSLAATTSTSTTGTTSTVAGMDSTAYPLVSAYVKRWLIDSTGLYVGAEMILVIGVLSLPAVVVPPVDTPPPPPPTETAS